ncbi:uncharacterized protein CTRU02_212972 [Colletotrichum truncatum]|uniref:Uncharacterized protein n=1 Tax=Colletotrichum truncatum TaxID=5467 RepID=A0ACC3YJE3_COLTU|nr:uncharacterized protein CTRU02_03294 [Colletotrichum truncatum]KAF6797263.1 hypothetical protein CTRU02_03294 [Colletotrichum truncatum]
MSTTTTFSHTYSSSSPLHITAQKKKMSITQTYYLAHKARAKLSSEAARADHDLRLLVGHANLLDSLMLELADAEREQESWFNQSVRGATKSEERHVQWADTIVESPEDDWEASSDDSSDSSDDDYDEEEEDDIEMADTVSLRRMPSAPASPRTTSVSISEDYDMEEDDLEDDYAQLELVRTPSHSSSSSPPELEHDSDISDDESMPPSPPSAVLTFSEKEAKEEISQQRQEDAFYSEGYYLPPRNPARLVSAISVY